MEKCIYCEYFGKENCSVLGKEREDKPCFKVNHRYKSKFICKGKTYYNIHHFNKFKKLLGKIIWGIKIEDC